MSRKLTLVTDREGNCRHLLDEQDPLLVQALGATTVTYRNSHVELGQDLSPHARAFLGERYHPQKWFANMQPVVDDAILGPFDTRSEALEAEVKCLLENHLPLPTLHSSLLNKS